MLDLKAILEGVFMLPKLLHIYRNTPSGRETWLQTVYFCAVAGAAPHCYLPRDKKFLLYFEHDAVQVDLDESYLRNQQSAEYECTMLARSMGQEPQIIDPAGYTATSLPDLPTDCNYMTCPRVISDKTSKIGLGHIGPAVRRIVCVAPFPVLIPSSVFKPWQSLVALFGGSETSVKALKLALALSRKCGKPLDLFTQAKGHSRQHFEDILRQNSLQAEVQAEVRHWHFFEEGEMVDNFMAVPHDALVVLGAFGHGLIRELVFGSVMELAQSVLPNSLLLVGPRYATQSL